MTGANLEGSFTALVLCSNTDPGSVLVKSANLAPVFSLCRLHHWVDVSVSCFKLWWEKQKYELFHPHTHAASCRRETVFPSRLGLNYTNRRLLRETGSTHTPPQVSVWVCNNCFTSTHPLYTGPELESKNNTYNMEELATETQLTGVVLRFITTQVSKTWRRFTEGLKT